MIHFADAILDTCQEKNSRLVVGLDPHWHLIPESFKNQFGKAEIDKILVEYFCNVVDACLDVAVMFKPQMAFFEQFGIPGLQALVTLIDHIHEKGGLVLMDAKRNDIGSTAQAYARAFFGDENLPAGFASDALTVNGYLGSDGLQPFLKDLTKGIFVLVKTSNPSSGELQDLVLEDGRSVAAAMADQVAAMATSTLGTSGYGNSGAVIGATYPEHMQNLRKRLPHALLLVPGYGAQGGDEAAITAAFDRSGFGALINSSRAICFPKQWETHGFDAVRETALQSCAHINGLLPKK